MSITSIHTKVGYRYLMGVEGTANRFLWVVEIHTGEWDTYRELCLISHTKPTAREMRGAVKMFKNA